LLDPESAFVLYLDNAPSREGARLCLIGVHAMCRVLGNDTVEVILAQQLRIAVRALQSESPFMSSLMQLIRCTKTQHCYTQGSDYLENTSMEKHVTATPENRRAVIMRSRCSIGKKG
jgi:hypothetical protein